MDSPELATVEAAPEKLTRSESSQRTMARRWAGRREYWQELIERQQANGQSIEAFCAAEKVEKSGFYGWRRKLGLVPESSRRLVCRARRAGFVELAVGGAGGTAGVVLEWGDGRRLVLDRGFDREALEVLLELLARTSG